jgi:hypothetical protein
VVFFLIEFPLRQQKSLCRLISALLFLLTLCAHTCYLFKKSISIFNWYQSLVHSVEIYFLSVIIFYFYILICLKLLILFLPLMVRTMAIGKLECVSFLNLLTAGVLLKLVGLNQRIQPSRQSLRKTHRFPMIMPSMLCAKHFLHLNSPIFQIANQPKKHVGNNI